MENIIRTRIHAGLEAPVKILHMTDVHLVDYDENDIPEKQEHLKKRKEVFEKEAGYPPHTQNYYFEEAFRIAEEENAFPVVTGDVTDIAAIGTRNEFKRIAAGKDFLYTPGSHEFADFCRRPGADAKEIFERNFSSFLEEFPGLYKPVESRVIGGLNIVTLDNNRDYFTAETLEGLKAEIAKGLPMIVFMHEPLLDYELLRVRPINEFTLRTPQEYLISDTVLGLLGRSPEVLCTFAGHWHGGTEGIAPCGARFYITPGLFKGICRIIEVD
ncbi:MAG: metallophosphoesterase [Clostridia bacterium]|nr:metallophosphoesterase [Clostridia bacterium]